jgi:hypothetical protein
MLEKVNKQYVKCSIERKEHHLVSSFLISLMQLHQKDLIKVTKLLRELLTLYLQHLMEWNKEKWSSLLQQQIEKI